MEALPPKVMKYIAEYLSRKALATAARVCRSWNAMLTPELYRTIDDSVELICFVKCLRQSTPQKQLGHFVRSLTLDPCINQHTLPFLSVFCPFVIELKIETPYGSNVLSFLPEWRHLSRLSLSLHLRHPPIMSAYFPKSAITELCINKRKYEEWIHLLAELPCIEVLSMGHKPKYRSEISPRDCQISFCSLEKIHAYLPRLRSFSIHPCIVVDQLPKSITPCDTVRELTFYPTESYYWGKYFAQKYTHLEKLSISILSFEPIDMTAELVALAKSYRYLQEFECRDNEEYCIFLDALASVRAPLKNLSFHSWDQQWATQTLDQFKQTVTSISLELTKEITDRSALSTIEPCLFLRQLKIDVGKCDIQLDQILCQTKHITDLNVRARIISIRCNNSLDPRHNLDRLCLSGADIEDEVYVYLSFCCPRLSRLTCDYDDNRGTDRPCVIYCPNPSLKYLCVSFRRDYMYKLVKIEDSDDLQRINNESAKVDQEAKPNVRWIIDRSCFDSLEELEAPGLWKKIRPWAIVPEHDCGFPMKIATIQYRHVASMQLGSASLSDLYVRT